MKTLISTIDQGLIFSLVAIAVYLTSRVIKKDDLTVEGSFGFGGAISALSLEYGCSWTFSLFSAFICGALIGACTGILNTKLKMNHLMAGLVTTTACFSLSLGLASANKIVDAHKTIFHIIPGLKEHYAEIIVLSIVAVLTVFLVRLFLSSELGLLLRAAGDNPALLVHFGKSSDFYYIVGFALANAITAVAGSLFIQWSGFYSITGNIGTLVTGLASLMIAELFTKKLRVVIIVSAIIYQSIFALTLMTGLMPVWNNLVKALIMVTLVALSTYLAKIRQGSRSC